MPGTVFHAFTNPQVDGTATNVVRPSDWNDNHLVSLAPSGAEMLPGFANSNGVSFDTNTAGKLIASIAIASSLSFANANGVTFGQNGSTLTASVATNYVPLGNSTQFAGVSHSHGAVAGTNISATSASNGLSLSVAAQSAQPVAYSAGNGSANFSTLVFANSNGVSFSSGSQGLYATVATNYAATNVTTNNVATANSSLFQHTSATSAITSAAQHTSNNSLFQYTSATSAVTSNAFPSANTTKFAGSGFSGTNISGTVNSNGIQLSVAAGGGGADGYNIVGVNGATIGSALTVQFSNSNNVSFGLNGSTITASASYPAQTVDINKAGTGFTTTTAAGAVVAGTHDTNGLKLAIPGYLTTAAPPGAYLTTARASNDAIGLNSALTANGVSMTANSSGLSLNFPAFLTTAAPTNVTTNNIVTANSSLFQHTSATSAITAAAFPSANTTKFAGTGFSGTNVSGTINSNGVQLSVAAPGGGGAINVSAGTASGNLQTILFSNANGVSFGLNGSTVTASAAGGGGGGGPAIQISNSTFSDGTLVLPSFTDGEYLWFSHNGANVVAGGRYYRFYQIGQNSLGGTYGSTMDAANAAGNINFKFGGNLFGGMYYDTLAEMDGFDLSVPYPQFFLTNLSATTAGNSNGYSVSLSAGAGGGGGGVTIGGAELFPLNDATVFSTMGQNSIYFQKFIAQSDVSFNNIERRVSMSSASSSIAANANHTYDYGLYSRGSGASTSQYNLIASSQMIIRASYSSNLSAGYTVSQGAGSITQTSAGTVMMSALSGFKHLYMPFTSTITAGGEYAIAMRMSSATTGNTGALRIGMKELTNYTNLSVGRVDLVAGISISNASRVGDFAQGVYSATSSNLPATLAMSGLTNAVNQQRMYIQFDA